MKKNISTLSWGGCLVCFSCYSCWFVCFTLSFLAVYNLLCFDQEWTDVGHCNIPSFTSMYEENINSRLGGVLVGMLQLLVHLFSLDFSCSSIEYAMLLSEVK
jgi:hypothetical protein